MIIRKCTTKCPKIFKITACAALYIPLWSICHPRFDDSRWKAGKGSVGDINGPEGTAPIGLRCEADGGVFNLKHTQFST